MKLRSLKAKDAEKMLEWMKDPAVTLFFKHDFSQDDLETVKKFIENSNLCIDRDLNLAVSNEADEYLGTVSLKSIDHESKNAEFAISLRQSVQGKGIGTQAAKEILKIAFEDLHLKRVYLNVRSDNYRAIHLYEKIGFQFEGEFRNHLFLGDKYVSLKWYAILAEEYYKN